jgi:hypothetical protein
MSPPTRKRWVRGLGVAALSLVGALAVAEMALRVFFAERLESNNHHRIFAEFDEVLGWRKKADFTGWHVTPEYSVRETLNERGLRGQLVPYEKPPGELRVLVLGDSFVEAYSVAREDSLSELLEDELAARTGGPVEVINAGTGGYSTDQELLFFREEGCKYSPDVTVLCFFYNDVEPNTRAAHTRYGFITPKPRFVVEGDELRLANVPITERPRQVADTEPELGPLERSFYVARLLGRWRNVPALRRLGATLGLAEPAPGAGGSYFDAQALRGEGWSITTRLLEQLAREVGAAGSRLVVFYVPTPAMDAQDEALAGMLGEACAEIGAPFVDPLARFREEDARLVEESGRGLYYPRDGHWDEAGHALAAQLLAESVLEQPLAR